MRTKWSILVPVMAAALGACGNPRTGGVASNSPSPAAIQHKAGDLLVVASRKGLTALDSSTGSIISATSGMPAPHDWSRILTTHTESGATLLKTMSVATGRAIFTAKLAGDLAIRVVSPDGVLVALMSPL